MAFGDHATRKIDGVLVVAVEGAVQDWAAYKGLPGWGEQQARDNGDKLFRDEAADLFPDWAEHLAYRA